MCANCFPSGAMFLRAPVWAPSPNYIQRVIVLRLRMSCRASPCAYVLLPSRGEALRYDQGQSRSGGDLRQGAGPGG